jgi:hypothetical protein
MQEEEMKFSDVLEMIAAGGSTASARATTVDAIAALARAATAIPLDGGDPDLDSAMIAALGHHLALPAEAIPADLDGAAALVRGLLQTARPTLHTYHNIGRIVAARGHAYRSGAVEKLAKAAGLCSCRLLYECRRFAQTYPPEDVENLGLGWSALRLVLKVSNPEW